MIALSWYILKMMIISVILYGYYFLVLRDRLFHKWNRFYLLATIVMSLILPLISIQITSPGISHPGTAIKMLQSFTMQDEIVIEAGRRSASSWLEWTMIAFYSVVSLFFFISFLYGIIRIQALKKGYPRTRFEGIDFINTNRGNTPFSFFNSIFWNASIDLHSSAGKQIFNHEMAHIREKHSYDKMFLNVVLCLFWINPLFWLIKKELYMIHEFVADKIALDDGDVQSFAEMVLSSAFAGKQFSLTNNFFHSPIKRRLIMIMKNNNRKVNYLTRIIALPIATLIFAGISCKVKSNNEVSANHDSDSTSLTEIKSNTIPVKDSTPIVYYESKKVASIDVITPGGKPFAVINYNDGSSEKITLTEAEKRGFSIPPPPPPPQAKVKFTPPKVKKDKVVEFTTPKVVKDDKVFIKVEKEASFPGGNTAWTKYITRAVQKSLDQYTEKDFGTCIVKFVVNKDGTVSDVVATTMKGTTLAKVAADAIKKGPLWIPAQQNDQNVSAYRLQPVTLTNPTK